MRICPLFLSFLVLFQCRSNDTWTHLEGKVFGTYYDISYQDPVNYQAAIDSFFQEYDGAVSKYNPDSELSRFNREGRIRVSSPYLPELLRWAKKIHELTDGALDPTLAPLINGWGFGSTERKQLDSVTVDSLLYYVDFNAIQITDSVIYSTKEGVTLDLNSVGEGFAIDWLSAFLRDKGISRFKVEIGGEIYATGLNTKNNPWTIGIENPYFDSIGMDRLVTTLELNDEGISTSGTYRNFFTDSLGNRYSHIIDPETGYPIQHQLLSVSIKAPTSTLADGLATACMVMGVEKAKALIDSLDNVEALFLYDDHNELASWVSDGFYD